MVKKVIILLIKAIVTYLALVLLLIDLILLETAIPRYIFEKQPFIQSAVLALMISAAISIVRKSRTPFVFTAVCVAYSAFLFVYTLPVAWFIAFFALVAAISFFYRNRITEPLLVLLPIIAGAWVFVSSIYMPYLVGWAYYITNHKNLGDSMLEALGVAKDQIIPTLSILPVVVMYLLGKHSYMRLSPIIQIALDKHFPRVKGSRLDNR